MPEFFRYRKQNPNRLSSVQLYALQQELLNPAKFPMSNEYYDYILWSNNVKSRQEQFADYVSKILRKRRSKTTVLEVGCGRNANVSRFLCEKGFSVICMDPELDYYFINEVQNLQGIQGYFDYKTIDLSPYDCVIAQAPYETVEHIIRACIAQNVPFIISICDIPYKLISRKELKAIYKSHSYLLELCNNNAKFVTYHCEFLKTFLLRSNQF